MPTPFQRARQEGSSGLGAAIAIVSVCSAVLLPLLIVDLGLIVQLLVSRGGDEVPHDLVLGPWVSGRIVEWPLFGRYELSLVTLVGAGALLALLTAAALALLETLTQRQTMGVISSLRERIHNQAYRLGTHDLLGTSRSRPEELFTDSAERLRSGLVNWWRTVPRSWIRLACLTILALAVNFWLTLLAVVLTASIARLIRWVRGSTAASAERAHRAKQGTLYKLNRNLGLAPLTTGYGLEVPPGERFESLLGELQQEELRAHTAQSLNRPVLLLTILLAVGFLLVVVGLRDDVTVSGTVVLGAALICAYFPAARLLRLKKVVESAHAAADEIYTYLDRESVIAEVSGAQPLERLQRDIKLDQITLADRLGQRLLDEVSLRIAAGERVAVLASDPETPIALAGLFVRFYDPAAGRILFDGQDICRATLDTVRGQALLVSGDGALFPGTVADNIACGDSGFTKLQIADAARRAQAHDFVQRLPQAYDTPVDGEPTPLTTDQRFRIGLARALLRDPSVLVIEEPPGLVDEPTMHQIERAVDQASKGRTVVLLPSMMLTLRSSDRVFLFHEGRLDATGSHQELVQNNELYRHVNYVRFNQFRHKVKW